MVDYVVSFHGEEYRYRVYEPIARKVDKLKKHQPGKAANMLKKANILSEQVDAEKLIDFYLKDTGKSDVTPEFKKQLLKGQPPRPDKLQDIPHRDTGSNTDQDITWASSSKPPYR